MAIVARTHVWPSLQTCAHTHSVRRCCDGVVWNMEYCSGSAVGLVPDWAAIRTSCRRLCPPPISANNAVSHHGINTCKHRNKSPLRSVIGCPSMVWHRYILLLNRQSTAARNEALIPALRRYPLVWEHLQSCALSALHFVHLLLRS